jgi:protein-tyrosine phosphatase
MIDIHSHILPGLDDGAQTMQDSVEMLAIAAACGTTDIVATPHANGRFRFDAERIEQVFRHLSERTMTSVALHLGCDFHLSYENVLDAIENPRKYTINRGPYLMVELPDAIALASVENALRQLRKAGIIPILTHPERNRSLQMQLSGLARFVAEGTRVQVTAQSLLGRFGRTAQRAAAFFLKADLVDFIASDAHDCVDRTPDLSRAHEYVASRYGEQRADMLLIHNPAAVLRGDPLPAGAYSG